MRNILLADNDLEVLGLTVKELYATQRFNLIQSQNGIEAYQKSRNQEFDLFIIENELPRMMGRELIKSFKENTDNLETPSLFYTSAENIKLAKVDAQGYKHLHFLEKSCKSEELLEKIEELIITGIKNKVDFIIDVEVINPFIYATLEVLNEKCQLDDTNYTRPQTVIKAKKSDVITSVAIISKYYTGKVSTCFEGEIFKKLASNYTGKVITEINDETKDIATDILQDIFEIANQTIQKKKFKLEKAIPALIEPNKFHIINNSFQHNLGMAFKSKIGDLYCVINVQKQKE